LISDTHSFIDQKIFDHLADCDEIWHAGDIGNFEIYDQLQAVHSLKAVWGNIDDQLMRRTVPEFQFFELENFKILIIHIAGKFASYTPQVKDLIKELKPGILVCGHSHILKIAYDKVNQLLYLNPGASGISGFHKVRTLIKFDMDKGQITNMNIVEMVKSVQK
ncbi:MAG: metallophosphoesterase family protein, partial [Saprospiraceae bacterium]